MSQPHHYIPNTDRELEDMLSAIGVKSFDDLLAPVPAEIREQSTLADAPALNETAMMRLLRSKAAENHADACSFLGAGIYQHAMPAAVDAILQRSEFYTAYTPYQAEVSQGTLQAIYEFQTMVCELYGMEIANASVYDGASALTEAVLLAHAQTRRNGVVYAGPVHPYYRDVLTSTTIGMGLTQQVADFDDGGANPEAVADLVDKTTACVVVQQPNFYGIVEDVTALAEIAHENGAMLIVSADPMSMAILEPPGRQGADIVVGEGQSLGIPSSYGGPALGLFAVNDKLKRRLPGRLVGRTVDVEGRDAYVLTLQTREQHIRREKATSNICTNESLVALAATVYLSLMGPQGLQNVAEVSLQNAHYAAERIASIEGFTLAYSRPFFREFVVNCPRPAADIINTLWEKHGILPGVDLNVFGEGPHRMMVATTEIHTRSDLDSLVDALGQTG